MSDFKSTSIFTGNTTNNRLVTAGDIIYYENVSLVRVTRSTISKLLIDIQGIRDGDISSSGEYFEHSLMHHIDLSSKDLDMSNKFYSGIKYMVIDKSRKPGERLIGYFGYSPSSISKKKGNIFQTIKTIGVNRYLSTISKNVSLGSNPNIKQFGAISLDYLIVHKRFRKATVIVNGVRQYKVSQIIMHICMTKIKELCSLCNTNAVILYSTSEGKYLYLNSGFFPCYEKHRKELLDGCTNAKTSRALDSDGVKNACIMWNNEYEINLTKPELGCIPMYKILDL